MNKNKILGIVVLVLVVLTLTSSLTAAAITDTISGITTNYKHEVVNTLIISVLLITAIALYPKLEKRQREIVQFVAIIAAIFISIKFGKTEYFWQIGNIKLFLHLKIWINTAVIAVVGLIIINIPKVSAQLPKEGMAKYAIYLVLFIMAFMIAISPMKEDSGKIEKYPADYKYVWELETIKPWKYVLLGDSNCYAYSESVDLKNIKSEDKEQRYCYTKGSREGDTSSKILSKGDKKIIGFGILRGQNLFIFILGTFLLIWLFNYILGKESNYINYVISILLAGSMAHNGMGWRSFIIFAEIVTAYLLYKGISKGEGSSKRKWVNIVIAVGLTHMIFSNISGKYHIPLPVVEDWNPLDWLYKATLPILVIGYIKDKDDEKGNKEAFLKRIWDKKAGPLSVLSDFFNATGTGFVKNIVLRRGFFKKTFIDTFGVGVFTRKGAVPSSFEQLFYLFGVHMNWMLRLEVFTGKYTAVKYTKEHVKPYSERLGKDFAANRFADHMRWYKVGRRITSDKENKKDKIKKFKDLKFVPKDIEYTTKELPNPGDMSQKIIEEIDTRYYDEHEGRTRSVEKYPGGCLTHYRLITTAMEKYAKIISDNERMKGEVVRDEMLVTDYTNSISKGLSEIKMNIRENRKSYDSYFKRYAYTRLLRYHEREMLDQYLLYGAYQHSYWFATPGADIEYCNYDIKEGEEENQYSIKICDCKSKEDSWNKNSKEIYMKGVPRRIQEKYFEYPYMGDIKTTNSEKQKRIGKKDYTKAGYKKIEYNIVVEEGKPKRVPLNFFNEVSYQTGIFLEDYNEIMIEMKTTKGDFEKKKQKIKNRMPYIRKLKSVWLLKDPRKIRETTLIRFGNYYKTMIWIEAEWDNWVEGIRDGRYNPKSRTVSDYRHAWDRDKDYTFKHNIKPKGNVGPQNPAFDFEALKNPKMNYWGRRYYYDTTKEDIIKKSPVSPYPAISTRGLSIFLAEQMNRTEYDSKKLERFLNLIPRDAGATKVAGDKKEVFGKLIEEQPDKNE